MTAKSHASVLLLSTLAFISSLSALPSLLASVYRYPSPRCACSREDITNLVRSLMILPPTTLPSIGQGPGASHMPPPAPPMCSHPPAYLPPPGPHHCCPSFLPPVLSSIAQGSDGWLAVFNFVFLFFFFFSQVVNGLKMASSTRWHLHFHRGISVSEKSVRTLTQFAVYTLDFLPCGCLQTWDLLSGCDSCRPVGLAFLSAQCFQFRCFYFVVVFPQYSRSKGQKAGRASRNIRT